MSQRRFIVKVQRPLVTNDPVKNVLIYNRSRSILESLPLSPQLRQLMGNDLKQFWYAHLEGTVIHLDRVAPWQEW